MSEKLVINDTTSWEVDDVQVCEWQWCPDTDVTDSRVQLDGTKLQVKFHPGYSIGTAAVRGNKSMSKGRHHYWEIKMISSVYGTDVMVGVGTIKADLRTPINVFSSLLGKDNESWGYSYRGYLQHGGTIKEYGACFKQGSIVGVHYDSWRGHLQFFLDRKPLGIAFTGLRGLELFPMLSSTAAKSLMRVIYSCSVPVSLQMECLSVLRPPHLAFLSSTFPGLKDLFQGTFAEILKKPHDDDDDDEVSEYPSDYLILDDYDYALIGCNRARKKRRVDSESSEEYYAPEVITSNLKAILLQTD